MLRNGTLFANEREVPCGAMARPLELAHKPCAALCGPLKNGRFFSMFSKFFLSLSAGKKIAFLAVFTALSVAVNFLSIDITPTNKITFTYLLCFFAGIFLGAVPAFSVAFLGDSISFLIAPTGVFWLFGLTLGLYAFLVGAVMNLLPVSGKKGVYIKAVIALSVGYLIITVFINSLVNYSYMLLFIWNGVAKKTFFVYLGGRLAVQSIVYAVNTAACLLLLPLAANLRAVREAGKKTV